MSDLIELRRKYEALKVTEDSKDAIIERLFSHIQILEAELKDEKNEHENQKRLVQVFKDDATECKTELNENKRKEARLQFVSVLVDGDHMNFVDTFVQGGNQGGRSAAKALIEAVQTHIREVKPNASPNIQYRIHVFANVAGLAKVYHDSSIVGSKDVLREFIQGFNMETPLCDFVDAGRGKECADVKIGALFEQYLLDIHCQHIVFGGSADNGYARILGHHRGSGNISLVEGPPFAPELRDLTSVIR
ncbi:CCCH zinc finger DNA binding protein [Aspergillus terreus]|uniref:CCCH zinc finger DNA binding protein n=1 Tax=Aspergillus terreus TaxID=33178 RepID=A0A5M3YSJ2_ASPTE|nr:hypothetical protein ATETN484_0003060300 [Aspergillus terreus]GFF14592.1 CCCH zinc finger DNA binding protein [Aspergillus terreus]